ncbi:MAG: branched-chain amino acid ABC transporter permease [Chloroflexi bacterium]|nr:MAG: branched-chain amino acid ABC transporter permease [Chloroflexota bacterium]
MRLGFWLGLAAAVGSLLLPLLLYDAELTIYVFIGLSIIVVAGLNLLYGFAGQVSLGQGAFYAIGAYCAGILARRGIPPLAALLLAPVLTAAVAVVVGLPVLRLRGHYLAFATLAFQLIVLSIAGQFRELTGGDTGLTGIPDLTVAGVGFPLERRAFGYAYLTWVLTALALLLVHNLVASRPGRGLRALATSEAAARGSGVPVGRYKLQVFALAAAFAGLAGGVYAFFLSYIAPGSFPILLSIQFLVMSAVGGVAVVWGPVLGAVLIYILAQVLQTIGSQPGMPLHAPAELNYAVYGLVLILIMLLLPEGIVPALRSAVASGRLRSPGGAAPGMAAGPGGAPVPPPARRQ